MHVNEPDYDKILKEEIIDLVTNHSEIYKYTNFESGWKIISQKTLAFRSPINMNDPFDCDISLIDLDNITPEYIEYLINKYPGHFNESRKGLLRTQPDHEIFKDVIEMQNMGLLKDLSQRGLTCFSETYSNLLMWSHYATSHAGICIGFDFEKLYLSIRQSSHPERMITKVRYSDHFEAIDYYKYPKEAIRNWFRTKCSDWKYEKEIRILLNDLSFDSNGLHIKYIHPECIKSIFLGANIPKDKEDKIRELVGNELPSVSLRKMSRIKGTFELTAH